MPTYCTLAEVKSSLRITDNIDDAIITKAITAAEETIDAYCARSFGKTSSIVRYYAPRDSFITDIDDLVTLTSIVTMADDSQSSYTITWSAEDFQLEPLNGYVDGAYSPATRIRAIGNYTFLTLDGEATVKVTGIFGWNSVPGSISQAAILLASRIYKRNDSPLGIISGELGSMRVGVRLDPDVEHMIQRYRRVRVG
jgi:uncharacterized phiE125 gp8 family phage protein